MASVSKECARLAAKLLRRDIQRFDTAYALIDPRHCGDAWFSASAQLRSVIESERIDLVIDVGANNGQFGQRLRRYYRGEILSFEPVGAAYSQLELVAARDTNWRAYDFALGSVDAMLPIHVAGRSSLSSLLATNEYGHAQFGDRARISTEELVSVRRLGDVLEELGIDPGRRLLLKMDTQGFDLEVFKGLGSRAHGVRALLSEVSLIPIYDGMPHWLESLAFYEAAGLCVVGLFPVSRDAGRIIEYDCLMACRPEVGTAQPTPSA